MVWVEKLSEDCYLVSEQLWVEDFCYYDHGSMQVPLMVIFAIKVETSRVMGIVVFGLLLVENFDKVGEDEGISIRYETEMDAQMYKRVR